MAHENNTTGNEAEIQSLINARIKAIYDKDLAGILAMHASEIVSFDLLSPLQSNGIGAINERVQNWFASYKSPISQEVTNVSIAVSEHVAYSHCLTRTFGTSAGGEEMDMWYRTSTGYKKVNGKWLITHDHNSEPIDMKTGKAMFNLKP